MNFEGENNQGLESKFGAFDLKHKLAKNMHLSKKTKDDGENSRRKAI